MGTVLLVPEIYNINNYLLYTTIVFINGKVMCQRQTDIIEKHLFWLWTPIKIGICSHPECKGGILKCQKTKIIYWVQIKRELKSCFLISCSRLSFFINDNLDFFSSLGRTSLYKKPLTKGKNYFILKLVYYYK